MHKKAILITVQRVSCSDKSRSNIHSASMHQQQNSNTSHHIPLTKTVRNSTFLELVVYDYTYYQGRNCLGPSHYFLKKEQKILNSYWQHWQGIFKDSTVNFLCIKVQRKTKYEQILPLAICLTLSMYDVRLLVTKITRLCWFCSLSITSCLKLNKDCKGKQVPKKIKAYNLQIACNFLTLTAVICFKFCWVLF